MTVEVEIRYTGTRVHVYEKVFVSIPKNVQRMVCVHSVCLSQVGPVDIFPILAKILYKFVRCARTRYHVSPRGVASQLVRFIQ